MNSVTAQALCPEKKSNCSFKLRCQEQHLEVEEWWLVDCKMWFTWKKTTTHSIFTSFSWFCNQTWLTVDSSCHSASLVFIRCQQKSTTVHKTEFLTTQQWLTYNCATADLSWRTQHKDIFRKCNRINSHSEKLLCSFQTTNHQLWSTVIDALKTTTFCLLLYLRQVVQIMLKTWIFLLSDTNSSLLSFFSTHFISHTLSECEWYYKLEGHGESNSVCFGQFQMT